MALIDMGQCLTKIVLMLGVSIIASLSGIFFLLLIEEYDKLNTATSTLILLSNGDIEATVNTAIIFVRLLFTTFVGVFLIICLEITKAGRVLHWLAIGFILATLVNFISPLPSYFGSLSETKGAGVLGQYLLHNFIYIAFPVFASSVFGNWLYFRIKNK